MKESWDIHPELLEAADESYRDKIKGTTAGLVIGDRAFDQRKKSNYIYDLGSEWRSITGLPFVFAAWISREKLPGEFIRLFDEANAMGLSHIEEIVKENPFSLFDLRKYYTLHLSYTLDEKKKRGMNLFLQTLPEIAVETL
jgi:chorismate dehydratase